MPHIFRSALSTLVLFLTVCLPLRAQITAVRAGHVINPETGQVVSDQTILIENGIIAAVGNDVEVPAGAQMIDLPEATVFPGLMDAHTHLCMTVDLDRDNGSYYYTTLQESNAARAVDGVVNARTMLEAGFTTVRDIGNEGNYACTAVREAQAAGRIVGPTIVNAGRIIAPFGGQFHIQPDKPDLAEPEYFFADTHDEMVKAIRENIHFGAGVIKIVVDDQDYIYSIDDIKFMKDEANRDGRKLAAHAWTAPGAHNAAAAGVNSMEHLWNITDEDFELAKQNGVVAVFTPFPDFEWGAHRHLSPEQLVVEHAHQIDRLGAGVRSGISIAFGSDAITDIPGYTRGTMAMERVDMYIEAGMTPAQLLKSMTTIPAKLIGVDAQRGAIRKGQAADLVATAGSPLDDPQQLKHLVLVMKEGRVIKN